MNGHKQKKFFILPFVKNNLDLNTILGYSRSFRSYCCRICFEDISNLKKQFVENFRKIRTKENYLAHSRDQLFDRYDDLKECVFNAIKKISYNQFQLIRYVIFLREYIDIIQGVSKRLES